MKTAGREFIYERIAGNIEVKIKTEVLKIGDRLPSLRELCGEHGISMNSALQAYLVLEGKGLIESRPQSGYYVCYSHRRFPAAPDTSKPVRTAGEATSALISKVYADIGTGDHILLSLGVPDTSLLPVAKLNKAIMQGLRDLEGSGTVYDRIQGNLRLRRQIAIGSFHWNGQLNEDDIITTAGCMNALSFCLGALLQKGDTLVVESPVYFGILQLARSLGLKVLELPTNPVTGIELDALKQTIARHKVKACLLVSNFNNPLGSCMPDEHKKEVVRLLTHHNIPLIEDDLYGDVYFGNQRPNSCKTYDESGIVLWCGSFSKTLAPGYRVGWVAPGRFKEQILQAKLFHAVSSATITQEAIGNFLETGRYENHLRKMRQTLRANSLQYMRAISEYFPHDTKVSHPGGGFIQWVELNKKADTTELYEQARRYKISIAPGRMFTLQDQYNNCLRLSYGLAWNEQLEQALKTLGRLAKAML